MVNKDTHEEKQIEKYIQIEMPSAVCTRLSEVYIGSILNDHDTFLFDCDGVLWCSPSVLPGAIELLNYLTASVCIYSIEFSRNDLL